MTNFIELTYRQDGKKFLLNVNRIKLICQDSYGAVIFVSTANDSNTKYEIKETYDEIKLLLVTFQLNYKYDSTMA